MCSSYIGLNHFDTNMIYPDKTTSRLQVQLLTRRNLLKNLPFIAPSIAIPLSVYAADLVDETSGNQLTDEELESMRAFIKTAIPDEDDYCDALLTELSDSFYGFSHYLRFLIRNLNQSVVAKYNRPFASLDKFEQKAFLSEVSMDTEMGKHIEHGTINLLQMIVLAGLCEEEQNSQFNGIPERNDQVFNPLRYYEFLKVG